MPRGRNKRVRKIIPVTRADFKSLKTDIKEVKDALVGFIHFAKTTFVTKDDLKRELKQYATRDDLKQELKQYAKKDDLNQTKEETVKEMKFHFDAAVENIEDEMKLANRDEIEGLKDHSNDHEERITVLEKQTGVRM